MEIGRLLLIQMCECWLNRASVAKFKATEQFNESWLWLECSSYTVLISAPRNIYGTNEL